MAKLGQRNVILTGFMGTGKSTIGRQLALRLGRKLIDTDLLIEEWADKSVQTIFEDDGEAVFRAFELQAAEHLAERKCLVVSTGGGFVTNPACVAHVRRNGMIVCLTASASMILERTWQTDRPLLQSADPEAQINALMQARAAIYSQFPQFDTTSKTPFQVTDDICNYLS